MKSRKDLPYRENKKTLTFAEGYRDYKKKMKKANKIPVDSTTYSKVNYEFNNLLMDYIFITGDKIRIPFGLGELLVKKYKTPDKSTKKLLNHQQTKKLGFNVYFNNKHSNGYYAIVCWKRFHKMLPQSTVFDFEPTPYNRRKLAALILTKDTMNRYKLA